MAVESGYWTSCQRANCGLEVFLIFCNKANFHWYHCLVSPFLQPFVKRLVMRDWRLKYFINQCFSQCVIQWLVENSSNPSYPITPSSFLSRYFQFLPPPPFVVFHYNLKEQLGWGGRFIYGKNHNLGRVNELHELIILELVSSAGKRRSLALSVGSMEFWR